MATADRRIRTIITNRKAFHDYEVIHRYEAGIVLLGTEVKSLRAGKISLLDAYGLFPSRKHDELMLVGMHIAPYDFGNRENHEPLRPRKLLLHAHEFIRIREDIEEKGLTLVPLSVFFSGPYIKVELGVVRGKKNYDKRQSSKERDVQRELRRGQTE